MDNASSHDESASVKTNVKLGGNMVVSRGKGSPSSDNDAGEDDDMDDYRKQMISTKSSGTGMC